MATARANPAARNSNTAPPVPPELTDLSERIGRFIEQWGFKRVHGRIWCHLYLADRPVEAAWIIRRLRISKALVSLSLRELLAYAAIERAEDTPRSTRTYRANPALVGVIAGVLRARERPMLAGIQAAAARLAGRPEREQQAAWVDPRRSARLNELAALACALLDRLLDLRDIQLRDLERFNRP
jgi:DNA-binding transcriptional regulator GbsR (MarR family)